MRTFFQDDTWQSGLEEIRVRVGQPIEFCYGSDNCYLIGKEKEQMFCSEKDYRRWEKDLYHASEADLREMLNYISNYSLYAYKEEIKQGYITIEGGHRVGVARADRSGGWKNCQGSVNHVLKYPDCPRKVWMRKENIAADPAEEQHL